MHEKSKARQLVKLALHDNSNKINFVRVNDLSTSYYLEDLRETIGEGLSGIMLPKAANKEQMASVDALLTQLESDKGLLQGCIEIVPLIE
ncbi:aldolase/citrate lyase family protein [Peribacillus butanolivorans]